LLPIAMLSFIISATIILCSLSFLTPFLISLRGEKLCSFLSVGRLGSRYNN
jgi:hypothetical protein